MFVYKITNSFNGKVYIGMDSGPIDEMRRWVDHQTRYLRRHSQGKSVTTKLGRAIIKYGIEAFKVEVIYKASDIDDLVVNETRLIEEHNSVQAGYNMLPGSQGYTFNSITDPVVRAYMRQTRQNGTKRLNHLKWSDKTSEERKILTSHLHTDDIAQLKSKSMIKYWSQRGPEHESQLQGLKTQWQSLTLEEKHKRTERSGGLFKAKSYIATSPEGTVYQIDNMPEFCRQHSLSTSGMYAVAREKYPTHKGWSCSIRNDI